MRSLSAEEVAFIIEASEAFSLTAERHETRIHANCLSDACETGADSLALTEAILELAPMLEGEESVLAHAVETGAADSLRAALYDRYEAAETPAERVFALEALLKSRNLQPARMPDSLFARFFEPDASDVERARSIELHRVPGLSEQSAGRLASWCVDEARPLPELLHCTVALGSPEASAELTRVVNRLRELDAGRAMAQRVGDSMGRCGVACFDLFEDLLESDEEWERRTAYMAVAYSHSPMMAERLAMSAAESLERSLQETLELERALGVRREGM